MRASTAVRCAALALLAGVCSLSAPSQADVPPWSAPIRLADGVLLADAGIDSDGTVTVAWISQEERQLMVGTRPAGAAGFSETFPIGGPGAKVPEAAVTEAGETVLLWGEANSATGCLECPTLPTTYLRASTRPKGGNFSSPDLLADGDAGVYSLAVAQSGEAAAAWQTAPQPSGGGLSVAHRPAGGRFGSADVIVPPGSGASEPELAMNDAGDAVLAWLASPTGPIGEGRLRVMASYRPAGGSFGPPELVWESPTSGAGYPAATIAQDGTALVVTSGDGGMRVWTRGRGSGFRQSQVVPGGGVSTSFTATRDGTLLMYWGAIGGNPNSFGVDTHAALRPAGGLFGPPGVLIADGAGAFAFDGVDNLIALWTLHPFREGDKPLLATTFTRFGTREGAQTIAPEGSAVESLVVNRAGAAAAIYGTHGSFQAPQSYISLIDRPADQSRPELTVGQAQASLRRVSVPVGCDETCRVRAVLAIRGGKRARGSTLDAVASANSRVIGRGRRARLTLRLGRSTRARLRRARARKARPRALLSLRAVDIAGNRRVARRTLRVSRRSRG